MTTPQIKIGTTLKNKNTQDTWFVFGFSQNKYMIRHIHHTSMPMLLSAEYIKQNFYIL